MNEPAFPNEEEVRAYIKEIYVQGVTLNKTRTEFHHYLQNKIAELGNKYLLTPVKEYLISEFRGDKNGYIDVVWQAGPIPIVAFEIDSSCRAKSVKKLVVLNSNMLFWVYYGISPFEAFVNPIDLTGKIKVIHLPTRFDKFGIKSKIVQSDGVRNNVSNPVQSYTFADVRIKYQNSYEKWTDEQDKYLEDSFQKGLTVNVIANHLKRTRGAIRARIKKFRLP